MSSAAPLVVYLSNLTSPRKVSQSRLARASCVQIRSPLSTSWNTANCPSLCRVAGRTLDRIGLFAMASATGGRALPGSLSFNRAVGISRAT
jgi:hypothetical protein